jgi:hypothetical protein
MKRQESYEPFLAPPDDDGLVSTSPARNALQSNLDQTTTLNKKTSWSVLTGSIRKGALGIKGAIDYMRGESEFKDHE